MLYEFQPTTFMSIYMRTFNQNRGNSGSATNPRRLRRQAVSLPVLADFYGLPRNSKLVVAETMNEDEVDISPAILVAKRNIFIDLHSGQQFPCNNMSTFFDANILKEGENIVFSAVDVNARAHISKRYMIERFGSAVIR